MIKYIYTYYELNTYNLKNINITIALHNNNVRKIIIFKFSLQYAIMHYPHTQPIN